MAQGDTYTAFIEAELAQENARRDAIDSRALGLMTTSSTLLGLIVAGSALLLGADFDFSADATDGLALASALFITSVVLALTANASHPYDSAATATMTSMLTTHWQDDEVDARNSVSQLRVTTIASLRVGSALKANMTLVAFGCQIAALLAIAFVILDEVKRVLP